MSAAVIPLFREVDLERAPTSDAPGWQVSALTGRLVELSGQDDGAQLTAAFGLVLQAQRLEEPVAWVSTTDSCFFPPDAAEGGVDLETLCLVRVPIAADVPRAAEQLLRSGAFGLVVLDLGEASRVPMAMLSRLSGLARKHASAVVFLTDKPGHRESIGSLVSLRAEVTKEEADDGFVCEVSVVKDKRRAPGWAYRELCRGPAGVR
jgi:recombination protein RecA